MVPFHETGTVRWSDPIFWFVHSPVVLAQEIERIVNNVRNRFTSVDVDATFLS